MLALATLALTISLLSHTCAAAHRPPLPRAGIALTPAKRIEGLLGLTARQLTCPNGYGLCHGGMESCPLWRILPQPIQFQDAALQMVDAAQLVTVVHLRQTPPSAVLVGK